MVIWRAVSFPCPSTPSVRLSHAYIFCRCFWRLRACTVLLPFSPGVFWRWQWIGKTKQRVYSLKKKKRTITNTKQKQMTSIFFLQFASKWNWNIHFHQGISSSFCMLVRYMKRIHRIFNILLCWVFFFCNTEPQKVLIYCETQARRWMVKSESIQSYLCNNIVYKCEIIAAARRRER